MNFRRNFHENFQEIFKKTITEKSLITQKTFIKIRLEIEETSCKEISFFNVIKFLFVHEIRCRKPIFSWTKI